MDHKKDLFGIKNPAYSHGHAVRGQHSSTYEVWGGMKKRCLCKSNEAYKHYGARGITVCERWFKFENFLSDMGEKPDGLTLERINNNLGYSPENCKWATRTDQARNKRNARYITVNNKTQTIQQWSEETGLSYYTIYLRLRRGLSVEKAVAI